MILTCPQCATRYQADEAKFPPAGRAVRCGKCRHQWHQPGFAIEPEPKTEPKAAFAPDAAKSWANRPAVGSIAPTVAPPARLHAMETGHPKTFRLAFIALAAGWAGLIAVASARGPVGQPLPPRHRDDGAALAISSTLGQSSNRNAGYRFAQCGVPARNRRRPNNAGHHWNYCQ